MAISNWDRARALDSLRLLLTGRCTLESPKAGGGWTVVAQHVPCKRVAPAAVQVFVPGGAITQQHMVYQLDPAVAPNVGLGWHLTDEGDGTRWITAGDSSTTEDLLTVVDAVRQG